MTEIVHSILWVRHCLLCGATQDTEAKPVMLPADEWDGQQYFLAGVYAEQAEKVERVHWPPETTLEWHDCAADQRGRWYIIGQRRGRAYLLDRQKHTLTAAEAT